MTPTEIRKLQASRIDNRTIGNCPPIARRTPSHPSGLLLASLASCGTALLVVVTLVITNGQIRLPQGLSTYLLVWAAVLVICFMFYRGVAVGRRLLPPVDLLEPPVQMSLIWLFWIAPFGIAPYVSSELLAPGLGTTDPLPTGMTVVGVGLTGLWIGYALSSKFVKQQANRSILVLPPSPSLPVVLAFYWVLFAVRLALLANGLGESFGRTLSLGAWDQWTIYLIEMRWPLIALIVYHVAKRRWPLRHIITVIGIEFALALLSGVSSAVVRLLLLTVGCWLYARGRKLPWRVGLLLIIAMLVLIPVIHSVRNSPSGQPVANLSQSAQSYLVQRRFSALEYTQNYLVARQSGVAQMPALIASLSGTSIPYLPLQDLVLSPLSIVPRVLWPGKPVFVNLQGMMREVYMGLSRTGASPAITNVGNLYLYGGWPIVFVGMLLLGIFLALLYGFIAVPGIVHQNAWSISLYAAVFISVFGAGGEDYVSGYQAVVQRLILFAILLRFIQAVSSRVRPGSYEPSRTVSS